MTVKRAIKSGSYLGEGTVPCKWCARQTPMLGTRMCDRCWHLDRAISGDLALAEKVLKHYKVKSEKVPV